MLKKLSLLILVAGASFTGCQTYELADVAPETQGTSMGAVRLGKQNKDFFVIPGEPVTPAQMRGEIPVPASNIVVFKTRERQPHYRAIRVAGAPIRGMRKTFTFVVDRIADLAFGWLKRDGRRAAPATAPAPIIYPGAVVPESNFARSGAEATQMRGASSAHLFHSPQTHRNGG